jgi:2-dehydropantoate 2-reductase
MASHSGGQPASGKKIAVLGSGANGSCVGADLTRAGLDPTLIDQWPAHVEAMRANGLRIALPEEERHVVVRAHHLCDLAALNARFDIVFLMPKAYDTRWMAELVAPHLADDAIVVGAQNAMTAEAISEIVGPQRTIGCVVELSAEVFTPGLVQRNTPNERTWFGVGALTPDMAPRVGEIADLLRHVGKVTPTDNVLSGKWLKLVVNTMCLGPFALMGVSQSEGMRLPGMAELIYKVGAEALAVGQKAGYTIEPIFGLRPEEMAGTNQLLEKLMEKLVRDVGPRARDCVLQDHLKGRYSEVDAINGLVVARGAELGIATPGNAAIVALTRQIHAGTLTPDRANLPMVLEMMRG